MSLVVPPELDIDLEGTSVGLFQAIAVVIVCLAVLFTHLACTPRRICFVEKYLRLPFWCCGEICWTQHKLNWHNWIRCEGCLTTVDSLARTWRQTKHVLAHWLFCLGWQRTHLQNIWDWLKKGMPTQSSTHGRLQSLEQKLGVWHMCPPHLLKLAWHDWCWEHAELFLEGGSHSVSWIPNCRRQKQHCRVHHLIHQHHRHSLQ